MSRKIESYDSEGNLVETRYTDVSWDLVREYRNHELRESDYRFFSDQNPSQAWIDYRVFLRDLPANYAEAGPNAAYDALYEYVKPE
tara:strand:+ start:486 stop:743 length:258 start_codon:yes stop_codon:yes gene_type:complete